jgi:hypothetical protein
LKKHGDEKYRGEIELISGNMGRRQDKKMEQFSLISNEF